MITQAILNTDLKILLDIHIGLSTHDKILEQLGTLFFMKILIFKKFLKLSFFSVFDKIGNLKFYSQIIL